MQLPEVIQSAVQAMDGSQAALSRVLGVSEATVSRWYSGKGVPDFASCLRLARVTGFSAAVVLTAAGHDPSLLPSGAENMTPEQVEVRARAKAIALLREVEALPEQHQDVAWEAALGVLRSFRLVAGAPIAARPVALVA